MFAPVDRDNAHPLFSPRVDCFTPSLLCSPYIKTALLRPTAVFHPLSHRKTVPFAVSFHRLASIAFSNDPRRPGFHLSMPSLSRV